MRLCASKGLLDHFGETAVWGERCGTCDNCKRCTRADSASKRDFTDEVLCLLCAARAFGSRSPSKSKLIPEAIKLFRARSKSNRIKGSQKDFFETLLMKLCRLAYVRRKLVKSTVHRSSWEVFELTNQGQRAIRDAPQRRIMLQPPESILQMERQERQRVQNKLQELRERGIDLSNVPALELESASGPTLTKLTQWNSLMSSLRARGEIAKAEAHEELLLRVFKWRSEVAQTLGMAPAQVLSEPRPWDSSTTRLAP